MKLMGPPAAEPAQYSNLIDVLIFFTKCTGLEIRYNIGIQSRYNQDSSEPHWVAGIVLLHYVVSFANLSLTHRPSLGVAMYHNANFASSLD